MSVLLIAYVWSYHLTSPPTLSKIRIEASFPTMTLCDAALAGVSDGDGRKEALFCITAEDFAKIKVSP